MSKFIITIREKGAPEMEQHLEAPTIDSAKRYAVSAALVMGYHNPRIVAAREEAA